MSRRNFSTTTIGPLSWPIARGPVARLDEPVIAPESLLETLFSRHRSRILKINATDIEWELDAQSSVSGVRLTHPAWGRPLVLSPRHVVLAAGKGNLALRRQVGLPEGAMQYRPLHMVLARGRLPELNGHCVDGAATRVTITSDRTSDGRTVWQLGGQIAESGVALDERTCSSSAKDEVKATIPGIELAGVEWSTYRVDRAEGAMPGGSRPETVQMVVEGNVLTVWPTKLALAPVLAETSRRAAPCLQSRLDRGLRPARRLAAPERSRDLPGKPPADGLLPTSSRAAAAKPLEKTPLEKTHDRAT